MGPAPPRVRQGHEQHHHQDLREEGHQPQHAQHHAAHADLRGNPGFGGLGSGAMQDLYRSKVSQQGVEPQHAQHHAAHADLRRNPGSGLCQGRNAGEECRIYIAAKVSLLQQGLG